MYRHREPRGQENFWVSSCWISVGWTGSNSQLLDVKKHYWEPELIIFHRFGFSVQSHVSQPSEVGTFESYGPFCTDFNNMMKRKKGWMWFPAFLPQSACFLPACVSVNTENRDSKAACPLAYMCFSCFFLQLLEYACARYSSMQLLLIKTITKKKRAGNVLFLVGLSQRDLYKNGFVKSSFSLTYEKVFILSQWINKKVQNPPYFEVSVKFMWWKQWSSNVALCSWCSFPL